MTLRMRTCTTSLALLAALASPAFAQNGWNSLRLTWTAPGDDGVVGTASQYDIRYSTSPIDAGNFALATPVPSPPSPGAPGSIQSVTIVGLSPSTTYWVALMTADEVPNWSGLSNIVVATTAELDTIRPAPLALSATGTTNTSVTLGWTAVGDDSLTGTAIQYDVRWSTSPITSANFVSANQASGEPTPTAAGNAQGFTVNSLNRTVDLYFAAKVRDEAPWWSALSNVVLVPHLLDTAPPAAPSGVSAARNSSGGGARVQWAANGESDLAGYSVYRAFASGGPFVKLNGPLITPTNYVDAGVSDTTIAVWYQVTASDATGNESPRSATFALNLAAAGIASAAVEPPYPNPSRLGDVVNFPVQVPAAGPFDGSLEIVNSAGERVRSLALRSLAAGTTDVTWDGRNDAGRDVAPGVYRAYLVLGGRRPPVGLVRIP